MSTDLFGKDWWRNASEMSVWATDLCGKRSCRNASGTSVKCLHSGLEFHFRPGPTAAVRFGATRVRLRALAQITYTLYCRVVKSWPDLPREKYRTFKYLAGCGSCDFRRRAGG